MMQSTINHIINSSSKIFQDDKIHIFLNVRGGNKKNGGNI